MDRIELKRFAAENGRLCLQRTAQFYRYLGVRLWLRVLVLHGNLISFRA